MRSCEALVGSQCQTTAPVGFGYIDRDFRIRRINETLAAAHGISVEESLGKRVADVIPEFWPRIEPAFRKVLATGESIINVELDATSMPGPDDGSVWLRSFYPVWIDGEIAGVGEVMVNVTEQRNSEDFREVVMANMAEGLYAVDREGRVTFINAAASRMLGRPENELLGCSAHELVGLRHPGGAPLTVAGCPLNDVREHGTTIQAMEAEFTRSDGTVFPVSYSAAPLQSRGGAHGIVVVFRDTSEETAERRRAKRQLEELSWVGRIRDALDEDRFVLFAQPIVAVDSGAKRCDELLLRMVGRDGEVIAPGAFLPAAEKYGLITEIDRWVVTRAAELAAAGRKVEVNLSAASIEDLSLPAFIEEELRNAGANPADVVFELTETAVMSDIGAGETFAKGLEAIGCGLALDDFGTGFGSFTYLKVLPIRYLKIDIEFVRELSSNVANQHLVKAIVGLANDFGYQTIAEGVEDAETLELLKGFGVDFVQGYHLGRPAPMPDLDPAQLALAAT